MSLCTVLVTDFSSYKAVVVARHLRDVYADVRVVTCDTRGYTKLLRSSASSSHSVLAVPSVDHPDYPAALAELAEREGAGLIVPVNSKELGPLLRVRALFGERLGYWGAETTYETLHNKARLQAALAPAGVRMPREYADTDDAEPPVVIKPVEGSSSKGVVYARSRGAVRREVEERRLRGESFVVQEYVEGEGVGFSGFFRNGRTEIGYAHRRLAEYPASGGSSVYRGAYPEGAKDLGEIVDRILTIASWSGFAMFEFKRTPAGEHVLIECNPRIWGSIQQGLANGVNYFEPLLGPAARPFGDPARRTYLSPVIYLSFLQYASRGRFGRILEFLKAWPRSRADVGFWSDPLGWLGLFMRAG